MDDRINEYAGQIKTARTEGILRKVAVTTQLLSNFSVTMACRFSLDHSSRALLQL